MLDQILVVLASPKDAWQPMEEILAWAQTLDCDVHLLYCYQPRWPDFLKKRSLASAKQQVAELQTAFAGRLAKGRLLYSHVEKGDRQAVIRNYVSRLGIDLLVLCGNAGALHQAGRKELLHATYGCPVLSYRGGKTTPGFNNILVPVNDCFPVRKIQFATYLALLGKSRIHLMGTGTEAVLLKTYTLLRERTNLPVFYYQHNNAGGKGCADLAKKVEADLIMVQEKNEYKLFAAAPIPVMAV